MAMFLIQNNTAIAFNPSIPQGIYSNNNKTNFRIASFYPIESAVVSGVLISVIILIVVLKLACVTVAKTTGLNKYDLIIFKTMESKAKNSLLIGRKMFDNNLVREHNLKAALEKTDF